MNKIEQIPKITIAGTQSGVGKTLVTLSLLAALNKRELSCQPFKIGPDYIDSMLHSKINGTTAENLDTWLMGESGVIETFEQASFNKDISIIEGVMGLYDGSSFASCTDTSTAEIAKLLNSPVILVIDSQKIGQSVAAIALGYKELDKDINIAGIILNKVGSSKHKSMLTRAIKKHTNVPVVGVIPRDNEFYVSETYLGLSLKDINKIIQKESALAEIAEEYMDIDEILRIAGGHGIATLFEPVLSAVKGVARKDSFRTGSSHKFCAKIGVAYDDAFNFYYRDSLKELEKHGAELIFFSPLNDKKTPENIDGLIFGGGYPEIYAEILSKNISMKNSITELIAKGIPVYAECGGTIYLSEKLSNNNGQEYKMLGVLPITAKMNSRRSYLGYVEARMNQNSVFEIQNETIKGHKFHYSSVEPLENISSAYTIVNESEKLNDGFIKDNIFASYIHLHFKGAKKLAKSFVKRCINGQ